MEGEFVVEVEFGVAREFNGVEGDDFFVGEDQIEREADDIVELDNEVAVVLGGKDKEARGFIGRDVNDVVFIGRREGVIEGLEVGSEVEAFIV